MILASPETYQVGGDFKYGITVLIIRVLSQPFHSEERLLYGVFCWGLLPHSTINIYKPVLLRAVGNIVPHVPFDSFVKFIHIAVVGYSRRPQSQ